MENSNHIMISFIIHVIKKKPNLSVMGEEIQCSAVTVCMFPKFMSYLHLFYFQEKKKEARYNVFTVFSDQLFQNHIRETILLGTSVNK